MIADRKSISSASPTSEDPAKKMRALWNITKAPQVLTIIVSSLYVCGFLAINSHLGQFSLNDHNLANSNYLIVGGLYGGFLVIWYFSAGRSIISSKTRVTNEIEAAVKHGSGRFWIVIIFSKSIAQIVFFTCLSAALFSLLLSETSTSNRFYKYLVILFLVGYPWDFLNLDLRFPYATQIFLLVTNTLAVYVFFSSVQANSPTMRVLIHMALISVCVNFLLDSMERFRITVDHISYNLIFSIIFFIFNSVPFGAIHFKHISSTFGGIQPKQISIVVTDDSVESWMKNIGLKTRPSLETKLIYENREELFLSISEDITLRLPKNVVGGIKLEPSDNKN